MIKLFLISLWLTFLIVRISSHILHDRKIIEHLMKSQKQ